MLEGYSDRWALVTGASSGIGAEFARRLAARGMHLVLTARRTELMEEIAEDLHTRHGTRCEVVTSNLAETGQPQSLFEEIQRRGIAVDLLVNNAGFGWVGQVDDTDVEHMLKMVQLNIAALVDLTYRFLPHMLEQQQGAVINISSVAAFQPVAYMPVYSASKTFVLHFSEALWAEARERQVSVIALCPGTTETDFFDVAGVSGWLRKRNSHTPAKVVKTALKALDRRRPYIIPGWRNFIMSLLPRLGRRRDVVRYTMQYFRPNSKTANIETPTPPREKQSANDA